MIENIYVGKQNSIKIKKENKVIYIDPYKLKGEQEFADIIFITHSHYDHFSPKDIIKCRKEDTIIVATIDLEEKLLEIGFRKENIILVKPNKKYQVLDINFETVPSYNLFKSYHPKNNNWLGYLIVLEEYKYYIVGDSDVNEDILKVKCDVLFVPIGGKYTMNYIEAVGFTNRIKPKYVIPTHYGSFWRGKKEGEFFKDLVKGPTECIIL